MSLTTKAQLSIAAQLSAALDLSTPVDALSYSHLVNLTSGTADGSADMLWHDTRTLTASGTENLDLAGALVNAFGTTQTFAEVVAVGVFAAAANTNNVQVTRPASNGVPLFLAASDGIAVPPGGAFWWIAPNAGIAVTAGTGDILTVTNSAGSTSVTYDVVIIGRSA